MASSVANVIDTNHAQARASAHVVFDTALGQFIAELFVRQAPLTVANFLNYIRGGFYTDATFYRATRPDNDLHSYNIRVIQGGMGLAFEHAPVLPPIPHESTAMTGLRHVDGALSMARWAMGTAASEFFIVLGDTPALDCGSELNPDLQGYAVFGRVVHGMDVVRLINASPTGTTSDVEYMKGQALVPPIAVRVSVQLADFET